jgi:hypothetical protein
MSEKRRVILFITIPLMLGSLLLFFSLASVSANTDVVESVPLNLSRSGAAGQPVTFLDANGTLHLIWQDRFAGFVYASRGAPGWSEPTAVALPFSDPPFFTPSADIVGRLLTPHLLVDEAGRVHAFWRVDDALFYSNAPLAEIGNSTAWSEPQNIAASAPAYAVAVDTNGRLHLAYVRVISSDGFPTGVYYRQRNEAGWSDANNLYQSSYLQAAETEQLHVDVAVTNAGQVIVAWDNRLLDTIFYIRSNDAGNTWSEPALVDQRNELDNLETPGPHYLQLIAHGSDIHLLWNRYTNVGRCELAHRWSPNGGAEWQSRQIVFDGISCPSQRHALVGDGQLYLFTEQEQGSSVVRLWLGFDWSPPQIKSGIVNFTNPETFRSVSMGCLQPVATQQQLLVAGCGVGNVEDIWLATNSLPEASQFTVDPTERWQLPSPIVRLSNEQYAPIVMPDREGTVHIIWLERDTVFLNESEPVIRYAYWDGNTWSRPAPIAEGEIDQVTAVITVDNRLLLVWRDLYYGSLWLSQVDTSQAAFPAQWSPPKELVTEQRAISQPTLLATADGQAYLAYAITLNEGRGIYVHRSEDGGHNWSEPMLAFDAAAAGWSMVDNPSLAQSAHGGLHLMWSQHDLLQGGQKASYYYARSMDNGQNWSASPTFVAEGIQGRVVAAPTGNEVFRLWQNVNEDEWVSLWYQLSEDSGRTWELAALLPTIEDLPGYFTTVFDPAGRLHLVHTAATESGETRVDHWLWVAGGWQASESTTFELMSVNGQVEGHRISAIVQDDGLSLLVFPGLVLVEELAEIESRLFYTMRPFVLPEERPSILPITPVPTVEAILADEQMTGDDGMGDLAAPVIDFNLLEGEQGSRTQFGPIDTTTSMGRMLAGVLPAGVVVIIGVVVGLYALRKRES